MKENYTKLTDNAFFLSEDLATITNYFGNKVSEKIKGFNDEDRLRMTMIVITDLLLSIRNGLGRSKSFYLEVLAPVAASAIFEISGIDDKNAIPENIDAHMKHITFYVAQSIEAVAKTDE